MNITQPYNWMTNTGAGILEDETNLRRTINLKSTTVSSKNKKRIEHPEAEQLRMDAVKNNSCVRPARRKVKKRSGRLYCSRRRMTPCRSGKMN